MSDVQLDRVRVASPCGVSWESMEGSGAVRFCGQCQLNVTNLSLMTRAEAEAFLARPAQGGRRCVRFYRRADGTILSQDCPVGFARLRRKAAWLRATVAAGLGLLVGSFLTGCEPRRSAVRGRPLPTAAPSHWEMGKVVAPVQPEESPAPVQPEESPAPVEEPGRWEMGQRVAPPQAEEPGEWEMGDQLAPAVAPEQGQWEMGAMPAPPAPAPAPEAPAPEAE